MALTRARAVCGDESLIDDVTREVASVLSQPRDKAAVATAIRDMRELIAQEKGDGDRADLKIMRGGLLDVEFIAQFLQLVHANARPELLAVGTAEVLRRATRLGILTAEQGERLLAAHRFYTDVVQMQRVLLPVDMKPKAAPPAVRRRIASGAGLPDEQRLDLEIAEMAEAVTALYRTILSA